MLEAKLYSLKNGKDIEVGSIRWDGSGLSIQPDDEWLRELLATTYREQGKLLRSDESPEEWLTSLHRHLRSAYLRATEVKEAEGAIEQKVIPPSPFRR